MITRESKKSRLNLKWVAVAVLALVFVASAFAQDEPVVEELLLDEELQMLLEEAQMPGTIEGTGTYFEVTDSEYLNIALQSSEPVTLRLESVPQMVVMHVEAAEEASATWITLTGFAPSTTYYKYEDDYHNEVAFTTDDSGSYTYAQDLAIPHLVFIQPQAGTIFLSDTGWSETGIGTWDPITKTGTLMVDLDETIQIDSDYITLDGAGCTLTGGGSGDGVYLFERTGVSIQNLNVHNFTYGIRLGRSLYNSLTGNNVLNNYYGIILSGYCSDNTLTGNTASNNTAGITLSGSSDNTVTGNIANLNTPYGIYLTGSGNNILTGNIANSNNHYGIYMLGGSNNTLTGNTCNSNNRNGIHLGATGNVLTGNTANSNDGHGISLWYQGGNTLTDNTANWNNSCGIYIRRGSSYNTLTGNTASNNSHGILLIENTNGNTLTGNTVNSNSYSGIYLNWCRFNSLTGNTASNNGQGIYLYYGAHHNTLTGNTVNSNTGYGIYLYSSSYNRIYINNFIDNLPQAGVDGGTGNVFNLPAPPNGSGGNYWSDWTTPDADGDGFVDYPYVIDELNAVQDNLPWTRQNGWANQPPEVTITGPASGFVAPVNEDILFEGTIVDPDIDDTHTAVWTISSKGWSEEYDGTLTDDSVSDWFQFPEAGIYSIKLTVTDEAGESDEATTVDNDPESPAFVVVYNPDGGFVTGGGWIYSEAGAYKPDTSLTGKANFGFVSKYKKGATVPTGNTEFVFHAGDLNFHSSSYDWLVVTGSNYARFKGSGTINGEGDYKFML